MGVSQEAVWVVWVWGSGRRGRYKRRSVCSELQFLFSCSNSIRVPSPKKKVGRSSGIHEREARMRVYTSSITGGGSRGGQNLQDG